MFELFSKIHNTTFPIGDESRKWDTYLEAKTFAIRHNESIAIDVFGCNTDYCDWTPRKVKAPEKTWQQREQDRLDAGVYRVTPFHWKVPAVKLRWLYPDHYLHCSRKQVARLAYTESERKGIGDIQTPIKCADYLARFGASLSDYERTEILDSWNSAVNSAELRFARTSEEILDVMYRNDCPHSCMIGNNFERSEHPYQVYGAGHSDLTLAYLERADGRMVSRCLVWEAKKLHGRVYGDDSAMRSALREAGFSAGDFTGARIAKIEHYEESDKWIMPYMDGAVHVIAKRDHFIITYNCSRDSYAAIETCGYISGGYRHTCRNCDEECNETVTVYVSRHHAQAWCESCSNDNAFFCEGQNAYYHAENISCIEVNGGFYSEYYVEDNLYFCQKTEEYVSDSTSEVIINLNGITQEWCDDAIADHAFKCRVDGKLYVNNLLSPLMTDEETDDESFICILNDERCGPVFHTIPEQMTLTV